MLRHVQQNAASLDIDEKRIGLWACSGSVPMALSVLIEQPQRDVTCAVLCYGYMLDLDGSTAVADASAQWGFANPCAARSVDDLPRDLPLFIARAGRDQMPGLNATLDRFVVKALAGNLPITLVNHSDAPHAFDLFDHGETSGEIVRRILAFYQFHLLPR